MNHLPSLKLYLAEVFQECYVDARNITLAQTGLSPDLVLAAPFLTVEQALEQNWLPDEPRK